MANHWFRFKQFTIHQDRCAMKVGTDSVILGSWVSLEGVKRVFDAGTGTGLLALMVAQRSPVIFVDAIELDISAASQAKENVEASPFKDRIRVRQGDFMEMETDIQYDLIICNPPYFENSMLPPESRREKARHAGTFSPSTLLTHGKQMLKKGGKISIVIPADFELALASVAAENGLSPVRILDILPTPGSPVKRLCIEYLDGPGLSEREKLVIEELGRHHYSEAYKNLTRPFYLDQ